MKNILDSWKSTLQGIFTAALGLAGVILTAQANPTQFPEFAPLLALLSAKTLGYIAFFSAIGKMILSGFQKDPDKASSPPMA